MSGNDWIAIDDEGGRWTARAFGATGGVLETRHAAPGAPPPVGDRDAPVLWAISGSQAPSPRALPAKALLRAGDRITPLVQTNPPVQVHPAEAARIAGMLAAQPNFDGVIWLAGPTSLWAHVSAEEIVSITRAASFSILAGLGIAPTDGPDLAEARETCLSRPERMLRVLANAAQGIEGEDAATGAVLGAELAAARPWWLGQRVIVLDHPLAQGWAALGVAALEAQGTAATLGSGEAALIAGLIKARES